MNKHLLFFGKTPEAWLAEYRRVEEAVAERLPADGGRFDIGDEWLDLLPVTDDDGRTAIHVIDRSDPEMRLFDVYQHMVSQASVDRPAQEPALLRDLRRMVEDLRREVASLKRSPEEAAPQVPSPYLTATEAAAYLRISRKGLYGLVERRKLLPLPGHRKYRFTQERLDAFLRGK